MKKCLFFAMFLLLIVSCKKDRFFDEYGAYGEGTALLNGHPWRGITFIHPSENFCSPTDTCYSIQFAYFNQYEELRGSITFDLIPLELGRHTFNYVWPTYEEIENRLIYAEFTADGDVATGGYHVFEQNDDNYVELTEVDLRKGDVRGNFQAVVVRDSFWTPAGYQPDTIRITDGSFYGKIYWGE